MHKDDRVKLIPLMALHLMWGLVLWFSISKYGLGVSTDSVHLLFGGLNLASGQGLVSYDGAFIANWPPLYPGLIALAHLITGPGMLGAATLIQWLAYAGLAACLSVLLLDIFGGNLTLALLAGLLVQAGPPMVIGFGMVGSDYLHLSLVVLALVLLKRYLEIGSGTAFVGLAVALILVTMERYLGVAVVAASTIAVVFWGAGASRQRLMRGAALMTTMVPMFTWLGMTSHLYTLRAPISPGENLATLTGSILQWFSLPGTAKAEVSIVAILLWVTIVGLTTITVLPTRQSRPMADRVSEDHGQPKREGDTGTHLLLLYGGWYLVALLGSASMAYFNKLAGRFLLPLYMPMILLPLIAAHRIWQRARRGAPRRIAAAVLGLALAATGFAVLTTTYPLIIESHDNGVAGGDNAFNGRPWRENLALRYWLSHKPEGGFVQLSNEPDGIAFSTQHSAAPSPRKREGPYSAEEIPISQYADGLLATTNDVYLLWIEPNPYDHYYDPEQLDEIAVVEPLFESNEGSVFRLLPKGSK